MEAEVLCVSRSADTAHAEKPPAAGRFPFSGVDRPSDWRQKSQLAAVPAGHTGPIVRRLEQSPVRASFGRRCGGESRRSRDSSGADRHGQ